MGLLTTRAELPYPELPEAADVPLDMKELADRADLVLAMFDQGTLAARPISTAGQPGIKGRFWYATDNQLVYYDHGTGWIQVGELVGEDDITNFHIAPNTVRSTEIQDLTILAGDMADGAVVNRVLGDNSVDFIKAHSTLKPSQGAGASQEALRAIGSAPGMAAAGIHGSTHRAAGGDPLLMQVMDVATFRALTAQDGMIAHVAIDNSTVWTFVYRLSQAAWYFVGGPPYQVEDNGSFETSLGGIFSFPGNSPTLTLPLHGYYRLELGVRIFGSLGHQTNLYLWANWNLGGYQWVFWNSSQFPSVGGETATLVGSPLWVRATLGRGTTIHMGYQDFTDTSLGHPDIAWRIIAVTPQWVTQA